MEVKDIREKAHSVCVDYIGGAWKHIDSNELIIEPVHGGFINYMFKLSMPEACKSVGNEPRQLLMKNFSNNLKIGSYGIMMENVIVLLVSTKGLSPKVYGVFDGGRLDEYLEGRVLKSNDFHNPEILNEIATKLALIHSMHLPATKDSRFIQQKLEGVLETTLTSLKEDQFKDDPSKLKMYKMFMSLNPKEELEWLKMVREKVNSPVVFCHGDFHMNNMMLKSDPKNSAGDRIRFVDWEIGGYNNRAVDLCKLFGNFCFDVIPDPPFVELDWDKWPSDEKIRSVIKIYLEEYKKITNRSFDMEKEVNQILEEIDIFNLLNQFWGIQFSFVNPFEMNKKLDLIDFGEKMFEKYKILKEKYIKKYLQ